MSLDVTLVYNNEDVFDANITHNLGEMARKSNIYMAIWRPEEIDIYKAIDIIPIVEKGLLDMRKRPSYYKKFDASNGWGTYEQFLPWIEKYLQACREYPHASIEISR